MRWNAIGLVTSVVVITLVSGCGLFGKKKGDAQTAEAVGDPYTAPAYDEPVQKYEAYPVEPDPMAAERTYPMVTDAVETPARGKYHTVAKQDTLYRLARMYYSDAGRWKDIYEANRSEIEDPNKIYVGQRLVIP